MEGCGIGVVGLVALATKIIPIYSGLETIVWKIVTL